jgi:hypothetical protein
MDFGDKIQYPLSYPLEFAQALPAGMQPDGLIEKPSNVFGGHYFNGNDHAIAIPNVERFNAKD